MNCDEKLTVTFSNNERMKYGKAIIAVSARARAFSAPALYFSGNSKSFLIKRIRKISVPVPIIIPAIIDAPPDQEAIKAAKGVEIRAAREKAAKAAIAYWITDNWNGITELHFRACALELKTIYQASIIELMKHGISIASTDEKYDNVVKTMAKLFSTMKAQKLKAVRVAEAKEKDKRLREAENDSDCLSL